MLLGAALVAAQLPYQASLGAAFTANTPLTELPRDGFYAPEQFPTGEYYSWTDGDATLAFPNPGGPHVVQVRLAGGPDRSVPVHVSLGNAETQFTVAPELRDYSIVMRGDPREQLTLRLQAPVLREPETARELGVVVSAITITGGGAAPRDVVIPLLITTIALYVTLRVTTRRVLPSVGIVLLLNAALLGWHANGGWRLSIFAPALLVSASMIAAPVIGARLAGAGSPATLTPPKNRQAWHQRMIGRIQLLDWLCGFALLIATLTYFGPYLFSGKTLIPYDLLSIMSPWRGSGIPEPQNWMMGDIVRLYVPWRTLYRQALLSGEMPFWNPYTFSGMPFMANQQSSVFYPFSLIFLLNSLETAFTIFLALHLFITGLGMYILLRRFALQPPAALAGALAWMFCGYLTAWLPWLTFTATLTWLPWCLFAAHQIMVYGDRRSIGLLAIFIGLMVFAGHAQFVYYNGLTLGAFILWQIITIRAPWRRRGIRLLYALVGGVLGGIIASIQIVPSLELMSYNTRRPSTISELVQASVPLWNLPTLLAPRFLGGPDPTYWGAGNFPEYTGYVGVSGLLFACMAFLHPQFRRQTMLWFFLLLALLALYLIHGGALNWLIGHLPGYTAFRGLQRLFSVWCFSAAAVVAWGVDAALTAQGWRRRAFGAQAGVLLVTGVIGNVFVKDITDWLSQILLVPPPPGWTESIIGPFRWASLLLASTGVALALALAARLLRRGAGTALALAPALLMCIDLVYFGYDYLPRVDSAYRYPVTPGITYLQGRRNEGRITRFGTSVIETPITTNANLIYQLEDIQGSDSFTLDSYNRLIGLIEPQRYDQIMFNSFGNFEKLDSLQSPLLDMLGAAFVLTDSPIAPAGQPLPAGWSQVYTGPDMTIYRNQQAQPLAFVVGDVQVTPSADATLAALATPDFNPSRQALIEQQPAPLFDPQAAGAARVIRRTLNTLEIEADVRATAGQSALLIIRQNHYPGWTATVDGIKTPIVSANYNLQSIVLAPGRHSVQLSFMPTYFYISVSLALTSAFVIVWLILGSSSRLSPTQAD
jgi:hypothetical protein